jgi:deoxyhypusine synthase
MAMEDITDVSDFDSYLEQAENVGFQASNLGTARAILKHINDRKKQEQITVYLGFTANMVASGIRGFIAKLVESGLVDVIVTTPGAVEHDAIKCFKPYLMGSFDAEDKGLHEKGINRIGNILVPSDRYVLFEEIFHKVADKCVKEKGNIVSPSGLISYFAEYASANSKDKCSFLRQCHEKKVKVFCPGITDGAIGLQTYFYKQKNKDFMIDVTKDMKDLADITLNAEKTAALILGGGISKHHIIGANIARGGLDYAIYLTTALEWDGSLSGARTKEAVSWGKISEKGAHVTLYGDATINLPLLMHKVI